MGENRELLLAIVLSILVLVGWQIYIGVPQVEQQQQQQTQQQQAQQQGAPGAPVPQQGASAPSAGGTQPTVPGSLPATVVSRDQAVAATPRIPVDSSELSGSINLKGARIDDLLLKKYKVSVKEGSPSIALLSPSGSAAPYYAEYGWSGLPGNELKLPNATTVWTAQDGARLTPQTPVTLTYDNGEGLVFERTISVDDDFMFTVRQSVRNNTGEAVTLHPYALISRHGRPQIEDFFVLHEGLIGSFSEEGGSTEVDYSDLEDEEKRQTFKSTGGWLGFVDKYWAAVIVPEQSRAATASFSNTPLGAKEIFQSDYLLDAQTIPSGATAETTGRLFAGAKVVQIIDGYEESLKIKSFGLLIDWGWFYFITQPMFKLLDWLFHLVGNFGVAILLATVLIKLALFPLANKSYVSMSRMKLLQPEMVKIRERYADDRVKQQQAMMELYKKEKVNPMAGCLPIIIQIPVFFALYKVLFGTIEMRHAPFYGWIQDLAAPDPTSLFNLFGLIPWDPPSFLLIGIWPLIMGITMFIQMRLNPTPPDPVQAQIFTWMPLFFTFLLASFPAGLVIYWAWNNLLSIIQQAVIMRRQGVKIELWDNLKGMFGKGKKEEEETG